MRSGFIGLGNIGQGIACELVRSGRDTSVHDVDPASVLPAASLGAHVAATPAEVAARVDALGICVRTDAQLMDVVGGEHGVFAGGAPGLLVCVHSTVRPGTLKAAAECGAERGIRIVDAPISRDGPATGKFVTYMLGGAADDVADAAAFVEPSAKLVVAVGGLGAAMTVKIANNLQSYIQFLAGAEAILLAKRSGVDPAFLATVAETNGVSTKAFRWLMQMQAGLGPDQAALERSVDTARKDLDCAIEAARDIGLDLPGGEVTRARLETIFLGWRSPVE